MKYTFSMENPTAHFLGIEFEISNVNTDRLEVQLPAWRPGRYELANFAKNIQKFEVYGDDNQRLKFKKRTKDCWEIDSKGCQTVRIQYNYYAAELNAGSTSLDESQMYVNPVNCCLYVPDRMNEPCEIILDVPYPFDVATGMYKKEALVLVADDFQELADSPFIASGSLQHEEYEINEVKFHIWFQGEVKPNWAKVQLDFERFTQKQMDAFGGFPEKEFHFLFQITSYPSYHGVEHGTSTVCQLGPSYDAMGAKYVDFLGVSSHELYHAWNVKSIRPTEMLPYNFTQENYSKMGYVYEGVTTYMGDKFLYSSEVFDDLQYFKELANYVERHVHNGGRFNLSVADSSFDTWLDGYVQGIPNRKTSIYTEGCLFSFILDVKLTVENSAGGGLDAVMKKMYIELAGNGKGYNKEDYINFANQVAGTDVSDLFSELLEQPVSYLDKLNWAFNEVGLELVEKQDKSWSRRLGLKGTYVNGAYKVIDVLLSSDAEKFNLNREDLITSLNGFEVKGDLDKWLEYFGKGPQELGVIRNGKLGFIKIDPNFANGYNKFSIQKQKTITEEQSKNFETWLNK